MVKSAELGRWWGEMTTSMAPIGRIIAPKSLKPGKTITVSAYDWAGQIETPTMKLSMVSVNGHEVVLADFPLNAGRGYFEEQVST